MATYYVATGGNDSNPGTIGSPKLTPGAGTALLAAGDTVYLRTGTYDSDLTHSDFGATGTSWTNTIRVAAYPGETVTLQPSSPGATEGGNGFVLWIDANLHYLEFDGVNFDSTLCENVPVFFSTNNGNDPHHIRVQNCTATALSETTVGACFVLGNHTLVGATGSHEILNVTATGGGLTGAGGEGTKCYSVYVSGPNNLIDGCHFYDACGAFVHIYNLGAGPTDDPSGNIVRNCRMHDLSRSGDAGQVWGVLIYGPGADNNLIYNNLIYDISFGDEVSNGAITVSEYAIGNKIWHNTIFDCINSGVVLTNSIDTDVRNNIAYSTDDDFLDLGGNTGLVQNSNMFSGVDPLFVDSASGDFRLQAGSPAIGMGVFLPGVSADFDATAYNSPRSIGAYEFALDVLTDVLTVGNNTIDSIAGFEDTRIRSEEPDTNFGSVAIFSVENWLFGVVGHTLIRMTGLATLSTSRIVQNFSMHWYVEGSEVADTTIRIRRVRRPWTLSGVTYNTIDGVTAWTTAGATDTTDDIYPTVLASLFVPNVADVWLTISDPLLTAYVQDVIDGTISPDEGLMIDRSDGIGDDGAFRFFTSSRGVDGHRPYGLLTLDEEDSSASLLTMYYVNA